MSRITIDTDDSVKLGFFIICQVDENGKWEKNDENRTRFVQTDTDLPSLAKVFGMTDEDPEPGEACEYLYNEAVGKIIDDPGYFD